MDVLLYQIIHDKRENQQEEGIIVEGRKDVPMNQKATRKITPAAVRLLALDAVRGAVIGMLIGTGGSKVLLAAALPERKLNLLYRPFAKVGKAALMLYSVPFVLAWILMLFGLTPSLPSHNFPAGMLWSSSSHWLLAG